MISIIFWVLLGFLLVFAVLDLFFRAVPSVFLTGVLFMVLCLFPENLFFGVLTLVFALLLWEFDFVSGRADLKVLCMIGLTISVWVLFVKFVLVVLVLGLVYKFVWKFFVRDEGECAFLPCLFFVCLALVLIQLFG